VDDLSVEAKDHMFLRVSWFGEERRRRSVRKHNSQCVRANLED